MLNWPWSNKKYQWVGTDYPPLGEVIRCFRASPPTEVIARLAEASAESAFHDGVLMEATNRINTILSRLQTGKRDKNRVLALIKVPGGLFLAWTQHHEDVTADSDPAAIDARLKLRKD